MKNFVIWFILYFTMYNGIAATREVDSCEQSREVAAELIPDKVHIESGGYQCLTRVQNTVTYFIELDMPASHELVVTCASAVAPVSALSQQHDCQSTIAPRPKTRTADVLRHKAEGFNSINNQARNTVISVPEGSYDYEQHMRGHYYVALESCHAKFADEVTPTYWAARIAQDGKITLSKFVPQTKFMQCADAKLKQATFAKPPSDKFEKFGGYPVKFEWNAQ